MRTLRHKLVAFYIKCQLNWLMFRVNLSKKPKSNDWIIDFRHRFDRLALPAPNAVVTTLNEDGVKGLIVKANNEPTENTIIFFHGGAYNFGSPELYKLFGYLLALNCNATVYLMRYRLAPEATYKEATADAKQAYQYMLNKGVNLKKTALGGDSAGGGLALALMHMLQAENAPQPACFFLLSPWLDLLLSTPSILDNEGVDYMLPFSAEWAASFVNCYTGRANRYDPLISPLYADFENLPPTIMFTGGNERFYDEHMLFADKIKQTNQKFTHDIVPDMPHDFLLLAPMLPEAKAALSRLGDFVKSHLKQ